MASGLTGLWLPMSGSILTNHMQYVFYLSGGMSEVERKSERYLNHPNFLQHFRRIHELWRHQDKKYCMD